MAENKKLILSLGSNFNHEKNISKAILLLKNMFGNDNIVFSKKLWTNPIDINSDKFLNCILFINTSFNLEKIERNIKELEDICGRTEAEKEENIVKIDIDILQYGEKRMHNKDWSRKYIRELMKECPF
ncbi:2-amino-4-hydroxy-6-hydroxymethyldihydropteridine diphosphokinase [uncultured Prevotella sp.]|uniref:2-amino-4-hydroxy-6- hydroxymethyldihydropteridine diphosphokinase n=1 Tax=uncultured Prevotella sp. TaxID=159272 RepID=UPI00260AB0D4|nr:2-amino-4-hydroxy-6-hydroxymethyldihydropteridine diphosphokinase [uncultured Prevotella sp.]